MRNQSFFVRRTAYGVRRKKRIFFKFFVFGLWSLVCFGLFAEDVNRVVALVNEQVITDKDLNDYCKIFFDEDTIDENNFRCDDEAAKKEALQNLVTDKLILDKAKKDKIEVSSAIIESRLNQIISSYPSFGEFEESLIERGLNITLLKERIKEQYMLREAIEKYVQSYVTVSPQEVSHYYQTHKEEFTSPSKYTLWILKSEDSQFLSDVYEKIKKDGFDKTQKEYQSSFMKIESVLDDLREELSSGLENLAQGEVLIKKIDGIDHLIYFEQKTVAYNFPLEEVKEKIHSFIGDNEFQVRLKAWVDELRKDAVIKVYW